MTNELEAIREALRIAMRDTLTFRLALNAVDRLEAEAATNREKLAVAEAKIDALIALLEPRK